MKKKNQTLPPLPPLSPLHRLLQPDTGKIKTKGKQLITRMIKIIVDQNRLPLLLLLILLLPLLVVVCLTMTLFLLLFTPTFLFP